MPRSSASRCASCCPTDHPSGAVLGRHRQPPRHRGTLPDGHRAVTVAVVLDAMDGRWRASSRASRAPGPNWIRCRFVNSTHAALLINTWSLHELKNLGWIADLTLPICCALRLARFNVALDDPKAGLGRQLLHRHPGAAGAGLAMAPMYLGVLASSPMGFAAPSSCLTWWRWGWAWCQAATFPARASGACSAMVLPILAGLVATIVLLIAYTWQVLSILRRSISAFCPWGSGATAATRPPMPRPRRRGRQRSGGGRQDLKHPLQIGDDVGWILDADREAEDAVTGEGAVAPLGLGPSRNVVFMRSAVGIQ